jgi:amino acid adenylation domain-containing protein
LPKPDEDHLAHAEYQAPQGATEVALAEIWQGLLNVERVSRHDNFFSLGGHSLLVTRLVSLVQQRLQRSLSIQKLFEQPVLKDLSQVVDHASRVNQAPILLTDRSQPLPLSWAQQRLWFIAQLEGGNAAYHISGSIRLLGELARDALDQSLETIVARHEALRTVFTEVDGHVWQNVIMPEEFGFNLVHRDIRDVQNVESALQKEAEQFNQTPFDLATGPLIRAQLVQVAEQDHVLLVTMHHIVSDAWSLSVLVREFNALYEVYRLGRSNPLLPLPVQYVDYAVWQRKELTGEVLAKQSAYWKTHLADAPGLLSLPTDYPRPAMPSYRGGVVEVLLDATVIEQVRALALSEGVTVHMVLHSVWSILMSRLSAQDQVVVGTPVANRQRQEVEGLIGFFVNTLALKVDLNDGLSVKGLLQQVRSVTLDGYAHQDIPFEQVVELVQPERSLRYAPVFQTVFNFAKDEADRDLNLSGLSLNDVDLESGAIAKFDLTLSLIDTRRGVGKSEHDEGIVGHLEYAQDLFDHQTVERWSEYFSRLLAEFVADLDASVHALPMLPEAESRHLLLELNQTQADYPETALIHGLFEERAETTPNAIAVVLENDQLSYKELNQRANQLAHYLIEQGVMPDTLVGLCLDRSFEMVIGLLGILKAGGAYVPLDPTYPEARLAYQITDADLDIVITQESLRGLVGLASTGISADALCLDNPDTSTRLQGYSKNSPNLKKQGLHSKHLAYVIYTSGTTGKPKGVMIEHHSLNNLVTEQKKTLALSPSSRVLQFASIAFDAATWEIFMALAQGGVLVMLSKDQVKSPEMVSNVVKRQRVTHATLPPSLLPLLEVELWSEVGTLVVAGESCPENLAFLWSRGRTFVNGYGPSETTVCATAGVFNSQVSKLHIGKPNQNTQVYVCGNRNVLLPKGVAGELLIGGAGLARGYLNQAELTAEKFITNPFYDAGDRSSSERLYKTGDLVRWMADGNLEFLGRVDHQVKLRGFRIELGEIESQLHCQDSVRDAVVVLDNTIAEGRLVAYLVASHGWELDNESLRRTLGLSLPEYMVPAIYVELETLPLTSNGKVDRKALPRPGSEHLAQAEYEAPQGDTEIALATIWQDLLNVEKVSRRDSFFSLGGHSLLATRLVSLVQQRLERSLSLQSVFEQPVLKELSNILDEVKRAQVTRIVSADRAQPLPLSWAQQRLWFIAQLSESNAAYHIPGAVRLQGELARGALEQALHTIVTRHEALRTVFNEVEDTVWQEIISTDSSEFDLEFQDLRNVQDQRSALQNQAAEFNQTPFDLAAGPLVRGKLVQLAEQDHVLLVTMHHVVSDGWSMGVLVREFNTLYAAYRQGEPNPLPALPIQYADYAVWQRKELGGDILAQQSAYWQTHLADAPGLLSLPTDHRRPAMPSNRGGIVEVELDATISEQVRAVALGEDMTVHMVLHAAWSILLSRLSGQDQIVVGTPVANRNRQEVEGLIGFFVNTLALRVDLSDEPTVKEVLSQVKTVALGGYANQDVPFEQVVELVQPERSLRHSPVFQAMFNFAQSDADDDLSLPGLSSQGVNFELEVMAKFDLTLSLIDTKRRGHETGVAECIVGNLEYARDLFEHETIERWSGYFSRLVAELVNRIGAPVHELQMLSEAERKHLSLELNQTQAEYPETALIHSLFEEQVIATPDAIAVVFENQRLTYNELNQRANQLAHHLIEQGVKPDTLVGLLVDRSFEMVIGLVGILKAGGAYVPLDPSYPEARLAYQIEDAKLGIIVTQESLQKFATPDTLAMSVQTLCLDSENTRKCLQTHSKQNPSPKNQGLQSNHLAYVIYTSGTTGNPKGVEIMHTGVVNYLSYASSTYFGKASGAAVSTALAFDATVTSLLTPLSSGLYVHLLISGDFTDELDSLTRLLEQSKDALVFKLTPVHLQALASKFGNQLISNLPHHFVIGGEQLYATSLLDWQCTLLPNAVYSNEYGPTETVVGCAVYSVNGQSHDVVDDINTARTVNRDAPVPIGKAINNTQLYVVDAGLQLCPQGVAGELLIGGVGLARGYLNQLDLSKEKFICNPFYDADNRSSSERLYKTGDLVRCLPDENLEFLGRVDHQVKLRGFRIELGEIEAKLLNQDTIREALVVLDKNGDESRLVAYLLINDGFTLDSELLRRDLGASLPAYMIPTIYIELDAFPLTSNGKVDRKALPEPGNEHLGYANYVAPQGDIEIALAEIWQKLLNVDRVGRYDNFFNLGGHSLLAITLINTIKVKFNCQMSIRFLFDASDLYQLAEYVTTLSVNENDSREEVII